MKIFYFLQCLLIFLKIYSRKFYSAQIAHGYWNITTMLTNLLNNFTFFNFIGMGTETEPNVTNLVKICSAEVEQKTNLHFR